MIWPLTTIKDVAKVVTGKTPSKSEDDNFGGAIPFVTPAELNGSVYVSDSPQKITEKGASKLKLVPMNAVMVCCIGSLGKLAIAHREVATNQQINSVISDEKKVYPKYGYYALSRLKPVMETLAPSTTVAIINKSKFEALEIPLPPLPEQKRIAAILDKADGIRRKRQQAIQLADEFLRSVFIDMFGDPVTNPKRWEVKKWDSILRIVSGRNQRAVEDERGKYPICGSGGFMAKANDWLTEANSVIIGRKGNINSPILMRERFWNVDTAFGLEPKQEKLSHNYLFWFCKFFDFERLNKTVTIPSLTKTDLLEIEIPLPPRDVQKRFDEVVKRVDMLSEKHGKALSEYLFESFSQKAFSGNL